MRRRKLRPLVISFVFLAAFGAAAVTSSALAATPCADCHEDQTAAFAAGPHASVASSDDRFCASCHGDPAAHLQSADAADIVGKAALAEWPGERKARACVTCHASDFPAWNVAPHMDDGLCWSCHANQALHSADEAGLPEARRRATWELCTSCHAQQAAELRMVYRHPVESGLVACTDCHDIHGKSAMRKELVAAADCLRCHREQQGPFLFVHPPMEQGCTDCHAAHGSPYRGQLLTAGNGTCLTCHLQSNFPGVGKTSHDFLLSGGGRCWDCHSEVHGSNTTPDFNPRGRR
jgi:DmsE family decaheme c-type cytochrome